MLYVIKGDDAPNSLDKRNSARPAHVARLRDLQQAGRLVIAGPLPAVDAPEPGPAGYVGSVIIAEFDSLEDAKLWAQTDPYVTEGIYAKVNVYPFKKVLPT